MTEQESIKRAIESAKCRIYRVRVNVGESKAHQIKVEKQVEIQQATINALEKQIAKKPVHIRYQPKSRNRIHHHIYCGVCGKFIQRVYMGDNYCRRCGTKIDWENEDAE